MGDDQFIGGPENRLKETYPQSGAALELRQGSAPRPAMDKSTRESERCRRMEALRLRIARPVVHAVHLVAFAKNKVDFVSEKA